VSLRINSEPKWSLSNRSSRVVVLVVSLLSLAFLSACYGNNQNSPGVRCRGATGNFTNSSLGPSGTQWAYELSGWIVNSIGGLTPYTEAGFFTVDGNGRIIGGLDDFYVSTRVSGTYSIISNGTGTINLTITNSSGSQALVWGITLANPGTTASAGSFAVIEGDNFANASGGAYQQNASALATAPSGTFVFRTHVKTSGISIAGAQDSVGLITFNPATLTVNVNDDYVNAGTPNTSTNIAGTFTAPSLGMGTLSFSDGLGARTFDYFVIDGNDLVLYETDGSNAGLGLGRAEAQQVPTGGFTNASFKGSFAFGSRGDTSASGAGGVNTVGQISVDGNGNITGGSLDFVRDGSPQLAQTLGSGTYSLASNGRMTAALGASTAAIYLVSPSRAFFLVNSDPSRVEDGTMDQQSTASFSNSSFSGQYAFVTGGSVAAVALDRTGTIQTDGNGNLGWAEQVNSGGSGNSVCLSGTYSASANGRVTASVSNLSSSLVFYMISPNSGYALQGDSGAQESGGMVQQNQTVPVVPGIF
jgi:fibronectin-binding autotransporter adhesin